MNRSMSPASACPRAASGKVAHVGGDDAARPSSERSRATWAAADCSTRVAWAPPRDEMVERPFRRRGQGTVAPSSTFMWSEREKGASRTPLGSGTSASRHGTPLALPATILVSTPTHRAHLRALHPLDLSVRCSARLPGESGGIQHRVPVQEGFGFAFRAADQHLVAAHRQEAQVGGRARLAGLRTSPSLRRRRSLGELKTVGRVRAKACRRAAPVREFIVDAWLMHSEGREEHPTRPRS